MMIMLEMPFRELKKTVTGKQALICLQPKGCQIDQAKLKCFL